MSSEHGSRKWVSSKARSPSSPAPPRPGPQPRIRLAEEGADIIAVDLAGQIDTVKYRCGHRGRPAETVKVVEALDRRVVATKADVRDYAA